ncbi:MAG TPA: rod shape-determining protein MreC [Victivallales bacterium]|nr:rod shape-determining protein MreC [Victivallales bacterium]
MKNLFLKVFAFLFILSLGLFFLQRLKPFFRDFFLPFSITAIPNKSKISEIKDIKEISEQKLLNKQLSSENKILREICKLSAPPSFKLLPAEISYRSPETWNTRFIVNKGESEGVKNGYYVISIVSEYSSPNKFCIIGRVVQTSRKTSEIATIFDGDFSLSVFIGHANLPGILVGSKNPSIQFFNPILIEDKINEVFSSKFSLFVPPFISVGKAIPENKSSIFNPPSKLNFIPMTDLSNINFIIIIIPETNEIEPK